MQRILVTGGAGFIGSAIVRYLIRQQGCQVVNVDKLTYAADLSRLDSVAADNHYTFENADICDAAAMVQIFKKHQPTAVIHAAAETHVDRSIDAPACFTQTNIIGTQTLLDAALTYCNSLPGTESQLSTFPISNLPEDSPTPTKSAFRFLHVSTDEVYGDLGNDEAATEDSPYLPSSPYAASKAAADHLVRAWARTYGLPILITHSSNNYGPQQNEEKLIPRVISKALAGEFIPVFGSGQQVRDWLHVEDNAAAIIQVLLKGQIGESYNIGANNEQSNVEMQQICTLLDQHMPEKRTGIDSFSDLIEHVDDRPGHDSRYALNCNKIRNELGWKPKTDFTIGLRDVVLSKFES